MSPRHPPSPRRHRSPRAPAIGPRVARLLGRITLGLGFGLSALIPAAPARAQVFHSTSATRDLSVYGLIYCLLPDEQHHSSTTLTPVVADTVRTLSECGWPWYELSEAVAWQNTTILDDALVIHHYVYSSFGLSNPMNYTRARASSDATISFRVEPNQILAYSAAPKLSVLQTGSGLVTLTLALTGPSGIVDSISTQAGPGGFSEHTQRGTWSRHLTAGDYTVAAHAHAEDAATAWGRIEVRFTFADITGVTPVTWSRIKTLYE